MILRCPFCQTSVQQGARTCPACMQPMIRSCENCNEEISVRASVCKYCGAEYGAQEAQATPEIEFLEEKAETIPWEEPKRGFFARWWRTWADATFHPIDFIRRMPREGGFSKPIGYAYGFFLQGLLILVVLAALVGTAVSLSGVNVRYEHTVPALILVLALFPLGYLVVAAGSFIGAGFWHVLLKLLGGKGTYQGTFRIVSYATGAAVWGLVPYIGGIIQYVAQAILYYHGFRQVHGLSPARAWMAILVPILLGIVAMIALVALLVACAAPMTPGTSG